MRVYAESSAILTWLLDEPRAADVEAILGSAEAVITSDLTLIESDRAIRRLARMDGPTASLLGLARTRLEATAAAWAVEPIGPAVVSRARAAFPDDAIRSLDAIHCATALVVREQVGDLTMLSLDERVRAAAAALGMRVLPD